MWCCGGGGAFGSGQFPSVVLTHWVRCGRPLCVLLYVPPVSVTSYVVVMLTANMISRVFACRRMSSCAFRGHTAAKGRRCISHRRPIGLSRRHNHRVPHQGIETRSDRVSMQGTPISGTAPSRGERSSGRLPLAQRLSSAQACSRRVWPRLNMVPPRQDQYPRRFSLEPHFTFSHPAARSLRPSPTSTVSSPPPKSRVQERAVCFSTRTCGSCRARMLASMGRSITTPSALSDWMSL